MALNIPPNFGLATMVWTYVDTAAKEYTTTCGYLDTVGLLDPDASASQIRLLWVANGCPADAGSMLVGWTFKGVRVLQANSDGNLEQGQSLVDESGTFATALGRVPAYNPLVVSKRTALAGRKWRGRFYAPYTRANEGEVNFDGSIVGASLTADRTSWNLLQVAWKTSTVPPYLLHTKLDGIGPQIPPTPIETFYVRPVTGVQRRRRARGA